VPYSISAFASDILDDRTSFRRKCKKGLSWLKLLACRYADKIFPGSAYTRKKLIEMGLSPDNMTIVHPGVNTKTFRPEVDATSIRKKYALKDKKILLTVARLDPYKGVDMVLRSLPIVLKRFPDTAYIIVGTGPHEKELKELVAGLNLGFNVVFAGNVPDKELPAFYNACDIFVMPSREVPGRKDMIEGFGISYIEASACGKPVIGGRSGGVEDAVLHDSTGLLVDPENVEDIAEAISHILGNENLAKRLGSAGRQRTEEELQWHIVIKKMLEKLPQG